MNSVPQANRIFNFLIPSSVPQFTLAHTHTHFAINNLQRITNDGDYNNKNKMIIDARPFE